MTDVEGGARIVFAHFKVPSPEALSGLIEAFERQNPGVKVIEEVLPTSTDQQHQFYVTALEGKSAAFDVFALDVIWIQEFARAGWLLDLTPGLGVKGLAEFLPGPVEAATYKDQIYAVPWFANAGILYFRKDLLSKYGFAPPRTFKELSRQARAILEGEQDPDLKGFVWQGKQYEGLICVALEFIHGNGGSVLDGRRSALRDKQAVEALQLMHDLIAVNKVSPPLVTSADEEATRHLFGAGRAIFMRNWPYALALYGHKGSKVRGRVGIAPLPSFEGYQSAPTLGGWLLGVNRFSTRPDPARRLVEFLTSQAAQKVLAIELGFPPARDPLYHDAELKMANPFIPPLYEAMRRARPRPVTPFYLMISQLLQPELSAAIMGVKPPERALEDASRLIEHILKLEVE
ncbi:putative sugar ABC transporter, periplasmic sugar-binding protein [Candidatus Methylomirabilis oxygeniifera]|uniref:Putative sugar ABC transporter, periplasmic sugar-binding protein n=1 Tax=Methylomirabilis oxygeniifera TaxID=671143 RepID=D5MFR6_METO1|nr:putative sugar ABC transporter, periplasmic sugar-binding protein [Candidatus Methylomirabilis oxyfera]